MPEDMSLRIAIREEGDYVNAYWAKRETMLGAQLLASISVAVLRAAPELMVPFSHLVQQMAEVRIRQTFGDAVVLRGFEVLDPHEQAGRG